MFGKLASLFTTGLQEGSDHSQNRSNDADRLDGASACDRLRMDSDPDALLNEGSGDSQADDCCENSMSNGGGTIVADSMKVSCSANDMRVGAIFKNAGDAKSSCEKFAKCPVTRQSAKKGKFVYFHCFRSGSHEKRPSQVEPEFQRAKQTNKCQCPFLVGLRRIDSSESLEVFKLSSVHNHELFEEAELSQLPQRRYIPEQVKARMLELNRHGCLTCSQIILLIENEFEDVDVTWTKRDVQNLFQQRSNLHAETHEFVSLLQSKGAQGWDIQVELHEETLRLERIFWLSKVGKEKYSHFHDVLEVDATYKTNR
jgi:hypothetical protein